MYGGHIKIYIRRNVLDISFSSVPLGHIMLDSHKWCSMVIVGKSDGAVLVSLSPLKFIWHLTVEVLNYRCSAALLLYMFH
jgi:hypothetical protein